MNHSLTHARALSEQREDRSQICVADCSGRFVHSSQLFIAQEELQRRYDHSGLKADDFYRRGMREDGSRESYIDEAILEALERAQRQSAEVEAVAAKDAAQLELL